jgi:hypothetical protein
MTKEAPEKIYYWLDTHLSIACHYGGCSYNGHRYIIDNEAIGIPLVREDIYKRERAEKKLDKKRRNDKNKASQTSFLNDTSADNLASVDKIIADATPCFISGGGGDFGGGGASSDYSSDSGSSSDSSSSE